MRVSNQLMIDNYLADLRAAQRSMNRLLHQSSTGLAFDRPRDAPAAVSTSLNLNAALSFLTQYNRNVDDGSSRLQYTETSVNEVDQQLQRIRELTVQGSNTYLTRSDRSAISQELNQLLEHVITLSNSNYRGRYIYSGYQSLTESFQTNINTADGWANSITYRGDLGNINRNIGINRDLDVNFNGKEVFLENTYTLNGKQLSAAKLGFNGAFELNEELFIVTPTMTLADVRDMINSRTKAEVSAEVTPDNRLKLVSLNSSQALKVLDVAGTVLDDLGILPRGAYNLAQTPPAVLPVIDSRGARDQSTVVFAGPFTIATSQQDMVLTLGGAANDGFTQTEVLKLDAKTYNTVGELAAEIQRKADMAFGADKLVVNPREVPPLSGNWFVEIETAVQQSGVLASDFRLGGTAPDGTVDTFSDILGFTAAPGVQENADNAGTDGNDRFTIDLGLSAYRTSQPDETPLDLPPIEINMDGDVFGLPAPPANATDVVANINKKILENKYLSGLVEAKEDGGRIRIQTTKKDSSILAGDLLLANAVTGPPVPATDTLGNLGFYVNQLTGESAPPVPATVFATAGFPPGVGAIALGVNDQFSIDLGPGASLDGTNPDPVTLTLTPGAYPTAAALAAELNNQISLSPVLKNAVFAQVRTVLGVDYVDLVTANSGSSVQADDLVLADVVAGTLANLNLAAPTTPGGGTAAGQGDIIEAHNLVDTIIKVRDELLGTAAPVSQLNDLLGADGSNLGLFAGSTIRISSDGTSQDFAVQRFTTMQDLADWIEMKLGYQLEVRVLRDGKIEIFNPATTVVNDIKIEALDNNGQHIAAFEQAFAPISGKLQYRSQMRSDAVYEDERFQHLTNRIGDVDDAMESILGILAQVGSRTKRLEMTQAQNDTVEVNLRDIQTKNDNVDMAETIVKLKQQENVLNAALGAGARILPPSLFDYLT